VRPVERQAGKVALETGGVFAAVPLIGAAVMRLEPGGVSLVAAPETTRVQRTLSARIQAATRRPQTRAPAGASPPPARRHERTEATEHRWPQRRGTAYAHHDR
jgi:hypothetical protein